MTQTAAAAAPGNCPGCGGERVIHRAICRSRPPWLIAAEIARDAAARRWGDTAELRRARLTVLGEAVGWGKY